MFSIVCLFVATSAASSAYNKQAMLLIKVEDPCHLNMYLNVFLV